MKPEDLPGYLGEIAEAAGVDAALAIAEVRGGTRIDIPARVSEGHWLIDVVGREAADLICEYFRTLSPDQREAGARHIVIPRGPAAILKQAQQRLEKELLLGASVRSAARASGLSERTAFRVQKKLRDRQNKRRGDQSEAQQLKLF
ncbi:conserved hypothetical protein [Roseibium sp. TrichSKD4]|uniref:hypothetical protein n=1 Tax=Roseibium sp. TrichSKD4 TaxID=744980 RepID=UPI0001E57063|nr:hypothetical protein [Roseibium sp. TrichSKD4]EFO31656.1 conserved hypothetical protein [Roseibium sp. TrichSKD4]